MLVTAVFCPASPLLVPRVAAGAAGELDGLRASCHAAIEAMLGADVDAMCVVAAGPPREWPAAPVSFARLGLPEAPTDSRPLALQVGAAMLAEHDWRGPVTWRSVGDGEALDQAGRVGVLCLGDGSARRSLSAPGYLHPDAVAHDEAVAAALADADLAAVLALHPADDGRLLVDGRAAWQAVARGFQREGAVVRGELLADVAPYGVGSFVARWWT